MLPRCFDRLSFFVQSLCRKDAWLRTLLCLAGGLFSALALAPVSIPACFFLGFCLLYPLLQTAESGRWAFIFGFCFALGFHLAGLYWISASLFIDIGKYFWVLPFSLLALPTYLALLFGFSALAVHPLRHRPHIYMFSLSAILYAAEIVRSYLMTGFPWNLFGSIWADTLPLLQSTSLIGIFGLTWLTLLSAAALAQCLFMPTRASLITLAAAGIILSSLTLWGEWRLNAPSAFHEGVSLRLVQGAVPQKERRTEAQRKAAYAHYVKLSETEGSVRPTIIIWPETAAPFFLTEEDSLRKALGTLIPAQGVLITGAPTRDIIDNDVQYYNSLIAIDNQGALVGRYNKAHLVPFGEFIPLRAFIKAIPVAADVIGAKDFSRGTGPRTLHAPGTPPFSPLICYEAIFSRHVVDEADRPSYLLQITNDAWFGATSGPYQHFAMARMRAVEEGLPLVRVANTGISAITDAYGRTTAYLPLGAEGIIDAPLPKGPEARTLYAQLPFWLLLTMPFLSLLPMPCLYLSKGKKTGKAIKIL